MEFDIYSNGTEGAVTFGWKMMRRNMAFYIGLCLVAFIFAAFVGSLVEMGKDSSPILFSLLDSAVLFFLQLGFMIVFLNAATEGVQPRYSDFMVDALLYFNFILGTVLYAIINIIGFILLIVPGIIFSIKYGFYGYIIIDEGAGPIEALKISGEITDGYKWGLFLFGLILFGLNLLGALFFGVGLLLTIPASGIAIAHVYRNLSVHRYQDFGQDESGEAPPVGPIISARKS